jgi:hypothetical protein
MEGIARVIVRPRDGHPGCDGYSSPLIREDLGTINIDKGSWFKVV